MEYFHITPDEARAIIAELQKVADMVAASDLPDGYGYTKGFAASVPGSNDPAVFKFRISKEV
jgi:hypothetical protein